MIKEITPIYLGRFSGNCYLLRTDRGFILIDTGMKGKGKELENILTEAGCAPGKLDLIILTHGHFDHTANSVYLKEIFNSMIAMHPDDYPIVEKGDMFANRKTNVIVKKVLNSMFGVEKFRPDIELVEGADLTEYGLDAKVLHIPGHTKGSIAILSGDGDIFCGDILGNTKEPERTSIAEDIDQMEKSVERLKALHIGTVYPGHGRPFQMGSFLASDEDRW